MHQAASHLCRRSAASLSTQCLHLQAGSAACHRQALLQGAAGWQRGCRARKRPLLHTSLAAMKAARSQV